MSENPHAALSRRLNENRNKVACGETVSPEEYAEIIRDLRANRLNAATPTAKARPGTKPTPVNLGDLEELF